MRIIVVDDMGAMRQTVKKTLNSLGFTDIAEAKNGKEAYDTIIASCDIPGRRIDLGVVDWNMAPISGLDLLKMIRQDKRVKDMIFVMLTAEQMRDNILLALQSKVDEYIIKPFTGATIKEKFDKITARELGKIKKEIDEFFEKGAPDEAEAEKAVGHFAGHYRRVGEISPWSFLVPMETGRMFLRFGKLDEAEKWLRKVISINFGVAEAHNLLSQTLRAMGKIPESINELKIAVVERPNSGELKQKLGEAYLREGKIDEAIEILAESLSLLEKSDDTKLKAKSKNSLGRAKIAKGDKEDSKELHEEAAREIKGALALDPDMISASYNLMVAYRKAGMDEKAAEVYKSIQSIEPKDAEGWVALGKSYMDKSEKSKALFAFKKADALAEGRFSVYEEISQSLYKGRVMDEALVYLAKAKELNPSDVFSYNLSGIIHRMADNHAEAVKEYQKASQLDPENAGLFFNLGVAYYKIGDETKSLENFKKAKALDTDLPELNHYMKLLGAS